MIENHKYQPSPIKLYLPFMMFLGTLILTSINWALFYFWKVKIAQSLIVNTIIAGICLLILDNKLYICIRLPINIAAAKLLDDNLNKLRESIVSQNPDYSFTGFERQGYYLISEGTK